MTTITPPTNTLKVPALRKKVPEWIGMSSLKDADLQALYRAVREELTRRKKNGPSK